MATHAFVLLLRVSAKQYADAARQLRSGNQRASPIALALIQQGKYMVSGHSAGLLTLMDLATGQHLPGTMPVALADYLAGFRRGVRVLEDHEFELVLESDEE